ncbi:MAG: glucose-6-phosphate dehydrogenase [Deltaproteobacteria bacterium]|jgi:glucose-6-phosphate 1-dehydrogenase|nr:glucose-6-phosphate dehydrogenase [Deltaproteobacteria bacterium]
MEIKTKNTDSVENARASVRAPDLGLNPKECVMPEPSDPCTIVIMGATGDLTSRKLMPQLFNLYLNAGLPDPFLIVGVGRQNVGEQEFRTDTQKALKRAGVYNESRWPDFAGALHYRAADIADPESFSQMAQALRDLDQQYHTQGNRIFYMALPPSVYKSAAHLIGQDGLADEHQTGNGWSRIVVEKPFGTSLETAIDLDQSLSRDFEEHQIFRIDHYLAKETVQNVLMLRFANSLFEPIWNRRYVDYIAITAIEELGVEHRAGYYEQSGVLRDMFQNHMMQLLALTSMEPPSRFEANQVRDETVKVFRSLRPFQVGKLAQNLVLGQYAAGAVNGKAVRAYRDEPGVASDSLTPTFAFMKVNLDNWRWQGVPFYLMSGKRLDQKLTEIAIQFKSVPHSMFRHTLSETIAANRLILGIYPDEKITLTFQTKNPGATVCLRTVTMDFNYQQNSSGPVLDAYARALIDCMLGDQMLFWRQDSVELCWKFLTPILDRCEDCDDQEELLHFYEAGSKGPKAVERLLP